MKTFRGNFGATRAFSTTSGNPTEINPYTAYTGTETGVFTSVNTPGFKSKKRGQLPMNPHASAKYLFLRGPSVYKEFNPYDWGWVRTYTNQWFYPAGGEYQLLPFISEDRFSGLDNQIRMKIKNSKVNLGVMGGELRETANLLDHRIGGFIHYLNGKLVGKKAIYRLLKSKFQGDMKVKRPLRFLKAPKIVSVRTKSFKVTQVPFIRDTTTGLWIKNPYYNRRQQTAIVDLLAKSWLEIQFGIKPLLNDIYGAAEAVANVPFAVPLGTVKASLSLSEDVGGSVSAGGGLPPFKLMGSTSGKKTIGVRFYRDNPLHNFSALGLTNPLSLAWELMTLSFVIDWFYPVGNTLDSLDATLGCVFKDGFVAYKAQCSTTAQLVGSNPFWEVNYTANSRAHEYYRRVLTDFPGVSMPEFRWPDSIGKALSGAALITQLFKR